MKPTIEMRLTLAVMFMLMISACHNTEDRVVPDFSGFSFIPMDTVQIAMAREINETSGLARIDDSYWTHNDSGGEPAIYEFDQYTGALNRKVTLKGAKNVDWEELTSDSTYMYIGDFGNNRGNRKNLTIYKVLNEDIINNDRVDTEIITFSYPDQKNFYNGYNHNHDSEAMITYGDSIYLFSKNWQNMRCKLYSLPKVPGDYEAVLISEFDSKGTITAAALSDDQEELYLLGYNPGDGFDPFIWFVRDWNGNDFISGDKERFNISIRQQTEAIIMANDSTLLITSEDEGDGHPSLYSVSL